MKPYQLWIFKLTPPFVLCLIAHLLLPSLCPNVRFMAFAPLITLIISWLPSRAIFFSAPIGLILDFYSLHTPFGFFSLVYPLTTLVVLRYRKYFLEEKTLIFALFSTLYSFTGTLIQFIANAILEASLRIKLLSVFTDIFLMPILDGVYALLWVLFPLAAYKFVKKQYVLWQTAHS